MSGDEKPVRRVKVTAEAIFEVTDVTAVEQAALEDIGQSSFAGDKARARWRGLAAAAIETGQHALHHSDSGPQASVRWTA
ncbi:hypothetical protein [Saccharopolyspora kobensis]|uniref:hypothetical protein n=1 Tax=Saccharopolyspora kobensis TaxID=146035 RepID=UPI001160EC25|nr:hypothetical protein [Saccharopolyspora kobensis]